ncbi:MAG: trimethylamine methyltransferase family protein [Candidatus Thermoplasmatota archaeon]|nr:trimethylamine methyltransferase family protein [Candidatus Thermoplasmatota archaeon]
MAVARLRFLDKDEVELIHQQSIECLERIGVMVKSPDVLKLLKSKGAEVDLKKGVAKLPESMVKEAIKRAPKRLVLGARDPKHEKTLPVESFPLLATTGLAVFTHDLGSGEKRQTTNKDLADFSKMADAMNGVDICWTTVTAHDVPQEALAVNSLWTALQNNTKHVQVVPATRGASDARKQVEIASLIAGDLEALRKKPLFSVISCSIAPLCFEKAEIEAQAEFARAGIPVVSMSMSISGLSSPVTIAGTLENINAENLASLTITQAAKQGAPFIYSSESAPMNMATGVLDYTAYQLPLIAAGAAQMAQRYGIPSHTSNWGFETIEPGLQSSLSEAFGTLVNTMSGTDCMSGAGSLDSAKGASLEQVVIDSHIWEDIRTYMHRFPVTRDTIALNVIEAVGHAGTFLRHPHTLRTFKSEMFVRDQSRRSWQATMSTKMALEARGIARKVLREHEVPQMPPDVLREGAALIKDYEKKVGN